MSDLVKQLISFIAIPPLIIICGLSIGAGVSLGEGLSNALQTALTHPIKTDDVIKPWSKEERAEYRKAQKLIGKLKLNFMSKER